MNDLSTWDIVIDFSAAEAGALIVGAIPGSPESKACEPVLIRMRQCYEWALKYRYDEWNPNTDYEVGSPHPSYLDSEAMLSLLSDCVGFCGIGDPVQTLLDWLKNKESSRFDIQRFSRPALSKWLVAVRVNSIYKFEKDGSSEEFFLDADHDGEQSEPGSNDPLDRPFELDLANLAFRAISKGYGDSKFTQKQRLIDFLETNYPDLKREQVQRIAIIANPDKTTGRKKRNKE